MVMHNRPYLELFPWQEAELAAGELFEYTWTYSLPLSPQELWPYIIDSSRFNRAVGYHGIIFSEENGLLYGTRGEGKGREEWIEYPFDWSAPYYVHRMRRYSKGFVAWNKTIFYLETEAEGCRITVYIGSVSAHPLARKLIPGFFRPFEEKYRAAFSRIASGFAEQKSAEKLFELNRLTLGTERLVLLDNLLSQLSGTEKKERIEALRAFILTADLDTLSRVRPLSVAREWNIEGADVLRLFLHAARAGIFALTWNTICPHCRGQRDSSVSLGSVPEKSHCDVCDIDFQIGDAHSVEVNFRLSSQIADLPRVMYCSAEPSRKQHILVQQTVSPGERQIPLQRDLPGTRVRFLTAAGYRPETISGLVDISVEDAGTHSELKIRNRAKVPAQVIYETLPWGEDILTPGEIFRLQEFRDLFSEEHLATRLQLEVGEQTIVFTDLVGSTRFYEDAGDAQAFRQLRDYFLLIYDEVRRAGGAVVKTIGDGAMLVFPDPLRAISAATNLVSRFAAGSHQLRITLHHGPCLAVNFNTGIDYFGRTVNLAAKLQSDCRGQQILATSPVVRFPGVRDSITAASLNVQEEMFEHPAFAQKIPVFRIRRPA